MLLTNRDAGAYFSEGAWEEWQAPSGHGSGVRGKKTPLSSIKMHLILDRVDYILYDVKHVQKCGGGAIALRWSITLLMSLLSLVKEVRREIVVTSQMNRSS